MNRYDLIVLGGGPGGYTAALHAAERGKSTLLIERYAVGGTCLNRGCIPTKAFLHSAELYHNAKSGGIFGVDAGDIRFHFEALARRKDEVVAELNRGVAWQLKSAGVTVISGSGRLGDKGRVQVGGEAYAAEHILLATGSTPDVPPIPGCDLEGVLTSDGVLSLRRAPASVVIIGGGIIGMEFAAFFSLLGIPVTVLEALPDILGGFDRDIVRPVRRAMEGRGVAFHTGAQVLAIEEGIPLSVRYQMNGASCVVQAETVILAAGRKPATAGVGLEQAGIAIDAKGYVLVDERMRTNVDGIYAIGDITGKQQLAHVASAQALVAVDNLCGGSTRMRYNTVPTCVYTAPEIAAIGLTEEAARRSRDVVTGVCPASFIGRCTILGNTTGCAKLIADRATGEILGGHICAPHATELIAQIAVAMEAEATVEELALAIHPHPTISEIWMETARNIVRELK